jgi:uncharacterized protein YndB with AHSA1/START domain
MNQQTTEIVPVTKAVTVNRPLAEAFRIFTEGIATWWPLETHSIYGSDATTVVLEGRVGGRLYEVSEQGKESVWGTVTVWEPPNRLVCEWRLPPGSLVATDLEIRFLPEGEGTRVELEHRGWERHADRAAELRGRYVPGWDVVLGRYVTAARR